MALFSDNKPAYDVQLLIENQAPIVIDDITWETVRKGAPSVLSFTVVKDSGLSFSEGNKVQLKVNGEPVFMGFIFTKQRDKQHHIKCTAYDQLRYFKNKDTYVYTNKSASDLLSMMAADFGLSLGSIANTGYKIPMRDEDGQTLFDIVLNALDLTQDATGQIFVLYDDFGKITLKNINDMRLNILVDESTAENFDYESSIDKDTYNKVRIAQDNSEMGSRDMFEAQGDVSAWGYLQYYMKVQEGVNAESLANTILKAKNRKTRALRIKGAYGNTRVRAGCSLPVSLNLGDQVLQNEWLMAERVTHHFTADKHSMDIDFYNLKGD